MTIIRLADVCLTLLSAGAGPDEPQVVAARAVYAEVNAAVEAKTLPQQTLADCTDEFSELTVAKDEKGVIRYLLRSFGGSDSSHRYHQYYDAEGRLRFVLAKVGAVPSAWVQARWWLDEAGKTVRQTRKVGGEGPQYYANDPKDVLVKDPKAFVAARTRCR